MKALILLLISIFTLNASNPITLPIYGIKVTYMDTNNNTKNVVIEREVNAKCLDIAINEENFWGGDFAHSTIPKECKECKKTFITVKGIIQPMIIAKGIKTIGEIEVFDFIQNKSSKNPDKYLLVDSRTSSWFENSTIPSAINIPYSDLKYDKLFEDEYFKALRLLGIKNINNKLDFSEAKDIILFCNGSWCVQSPRAIKQLIKKGYPKNKIQWYRGGMQDWTAVGLTTTKSK